MIESRFWKEELARIAGTLRRVKRPRRWTERAHCVVERDLMIGFFLLRRVIELGRVSSLTRDHQLEVYASRSRGKAVTKLNHADLERLYDLAQEVPQTKAPLYIANQFVHAYTSFISRDSSRNWSDVLVVSDFDRNDCIWRVPIESVRRLFMVAAEDYPDQISFKYNSKKGDFEVKTN